MIVRLVFLAGLVLAVGACGFRGNLLDNLVTGAGGSPIENVKQVVVELIDEGQYLAARVEFNAWLRERAESGVPLTIEESAAARKITQTLDVAGFQVAEKRPALALIRLAQKYLAELGRGGGEADKLKRETRALLGRVFPTAPTFALPGG